MNDAMKGARDHLRSRVSARLGRADRSPVGLWFWEIDRVLLLIALLLIAIGLLAVAAASPASARRYSGGDVIIEPLYYFWRQLGWAGASVLVMFVVSMFPVQFARRVALIGAALFLAALMAVPLIGFEANGAQRWLGVGFSQFQPSEFLKPCFIVATAWLLSLRAKDRALPVIPLSGVLLLVIAGLLMKQPDFGQTVIFCSIWMVLLTLAGVSPRVIGGLIGAGAVAVGAAYLFYDTARARINGFLFPDADDLQKVDGHQAEAAHAALTSGGLIGTGPGGGTQKFRLPEAHTDYIFSVIGEEFGLIACAIIVLLFVALVVRVFVKLLDEQDEFRLLAAAGLATQFGLQAMINMAVNVGLAPSKGMTLPFISYGGSSMIALSLGMGLLLAFTRRNPYLGGSPYVVRWSGS